MVDMRGWWVGASKRVGHEAGPQVPIPTVERVAEMLKTATEDCEPWGWIQIVSWLRYCKSPETEAEVTSIHAIVEAAKTLRSISDGALWRPEEASDATAKPHG